MTNFLIWKVYLFQFFNPATVASYISYVTLVLLVTFRHAQFFTGDIFPSSLRGEHLVVRSHSLCCTHWYIFTDFCPGIIFLCTKLGMSQHICKSMFNVELWMPQFVFSNIFKIGMSQGLKIWRGRVIRGAKILGEASIKGGAKIGGGGGAYNPSPFQHAWVIMFYLYGSAFSLFFLLNFSLH